MREIKFRAWDKVNGVMGKVLEIDFRINHLRIIKHEKIMFDEFRPFCEFNLMQYTGLKDKNGKEIYEGDLVKGAFTLEYEVGEIIFDQGCFKAKCQDEINCWAVPHKWEFAKEWILDAIEVIGNVWENSELLKCDQP